MASVDAQESYQRISGEGSSWAANAIDAMRVNVRQFGITVDFNPSGSSAGRKNYLNGTVDFAASDIPFQFAPEDGSAPENPAPNSYVYIPVTAGGTAFMYNLKINGQQVTNLRLSGENISKIFTGVIKLWNDPAIAADNPGIALPARRIIPVVRSDGSGTTAQFTGWMAKEHPQLWGELCQREGIRFNGSCPFTSNYPSVGGFVSQSGSLGVAGYTASSTAEGAITYVEYSYALRAQFPVAKILNSAGYYVEPTDQAVAVGLLAARINNDRADRDRYLTQDLSGVYRNGDARSYPLSSYSYMIIPTAIEGSFTENKGLTLADFVSYFLCEGQQQAEVLGYSPLPVNLAAAGLEQAQKIPGGNPRNTTTATCNNPTFSADGTNKLANEAPQPQACDKKGADQCLTGTGGASDVTTAASSGGSAAGSSAGSGGGSQSGSGPSGDSDTAAPSATTGEATGLTGGGTPVVAGSPIDLPAQSLPASTFALMVLAAVLVLFTVLLPPIIARQRVAAAGAPAAPKRAERLKKLSASNSRQGIPKVHLKSPFRKGTRVTPPVVGS